MLPAVPNRARSETGNARGASLFLSAGDWPRARWTLMLSLRDEADDHRVWARLALTYVEEQRPAAALDALEHALRMAPECPLLLWYRSSVLELLGREREAISAYQWLLDRGVTKLARGECGVGRNAARGLISDCCERLSVLHENEGRPEVASSFHARHLEALARGHRGVFTLEDALSLDDVRRRSDIRVRRDQRIEH